VQDPCLRNVKKGGLHASADLVPKLQQGSGRGRAAPDPEAIACTLAAYGLRDCCRGGLGRLARVGPQRSDRRRSPGRRAFRTTCSWIRDKHKARDGCQTHSRQVDRGTRAIETAQLACSTIKKPAPYSGSVTKMIDREHNLTSGGTRATAGRRLPGRRTRKSVGGESREN